MKKILIMALCLASSAYAGGYVDGNVGVNTWNGGFAAGVNGGYMVNQYLGVEAGFTGTSGYSMFDGAVKGNLPIGDLFDVYGKLGLGLPTCGSCDTGLYYGYGLGFNASKDWQLYVENYSITGNNPNFLMFGAGYKF